MKRKQFHSLHKQIKYAHRRRRWKQNKYEKGFAEVELKNFARMAKQKIKMLRRKNIEQVRFLSQ